MLSSLYPTLNQALDPIPTKVEPKLPKLEDIRAIIFDIYGTLVVSGTGDISIAQSIDKEQELRSILGSRAIKPDASLNLTDLFFSHIKQDHAQSKLQGAAYPEVDIREIWERFFRSLHDLNSDHLIPEADAIEEIAVHFECAVNPVWPMPGLERVLELLNTAQFQLGIVSNAQFYTPLMLEGFTGRSLDQLGFRKDLSVWSYQERLGKPSVELFTKLTDSLSALGIKASQALYVGNDMLNDIWTANQAGLRTALFAGDGRSLRLRENDPRCQDLEADAVVTELGQLLDLV